MSDKKTFFISRAGADKRWAELIASVVRDAGHEPFFEDEHFPPGQSILYNMNRGAEADCTIAVWSPAYFESEHCVAELNAPVMQSPLGLKGRLIPIRVAPVEIPPLYAQLAYLDLVGVDHDTARQRLLTSLLKHGQVDATSLSLVGRTQRVAEQADRNRTAMIGKVRTIWIEGYLRHSLFNEVRIMLGLNVRPDAVARPMDLLVKRPDQGELPLPPGTQVVDVFDKMDRSLLMLGAPGSGKTMLLLELTRGLIDRATNDRAHPIPVVFPLSTWAETRKPLGEWLQDELILRYDIPRAIAHEWVVTDQVLPLLDGLDEVKNEHQTACVEAINAFRQSHGFLPVAITSRTADYNALATPLRLQGAILVRPLTREQVNTYLADLGSAGEKVCTAIRSDAQISELLKSPLMLNVAAMAYASQTSAPQPAHEMVSDRRKHLFESYVNQMLGRGPKDERFTPDKTCRWLRCLGYQMRNHGLTVFQLEYLQRDWLPRRLLWTISLSSALVGALTVGLLGALLGMLAGTLAERRVGNVNGGAFGGLVLGLFGGLVLGLIGEWPFIRGQPISFIKSFRFSRPKTSRSGQLVFRLVGGMIFALIIGWFIGLAEGLFSGLGVVLGVGLLSSLTFDVVEETAAPTEGVRKSAGNALLLASIFGLFGGLGTGLFGWLIGRFYGVWFDRVYGGLFGTLYGGIFAVLFGGLHGGGQACLTHAVLRVWLIRNGLTPWDYVKFLDYAAKRILLRKVGGGYMFIHRMLLEWFAEQYVEPGVSGDAPSEHA